MVVCELLKVPMFMLWFASNSRMCTYTLMTSAYCGLGLHILSCLILTILNSRYRYPPFIDEETEV